MSLYNMVCGNNPLAHILLKIIDVNLDDIPRFRDVYINAGPEPEIVIYTRTGRGNREHYLPEIVAMAANPLFVGESEDNFDSTFANYRFRVPDQFKDRIVRLQLALGRYAKFKTPAEKMDLALGQIEGRQAIPSEDEVDDAYALAKADEIIQGLVADLGLAGLEDAPSDSL